MARDDAFAGVAIMALSAGVGFLLHGRSRASAADRKRIEKFNALPGVKYRLGFDFWGYELRATALDGPPREDEALEAAKFFWFARGEPRPDRGAHSAIVFRDDRGRAAFRVGTAPRGSAPEFQRTLYVFGDVLRPVAPMRSAAIEKVRDLGPGNR